MKRKHDISAMLERTISIVGQQIEHLEARSDDELSFGDVQQLQLLQAMLINVDARNRKADLQDDLQKLDDAKLKELALEAVKTMPELVGLDDVDPS